MDIQAKAQRAALFALILFVSSVQADPIFFDDFNDGFSGWTINGNASSSTQRALVPYSVRLRGSGSTLSRSFSTLGWQDVDISFFIAARRLEGNDRCVVEISSDAGSSWVEVKALSADQDNDQLRWEVVRSPDYDNNPDLRLRYRAEVDSYYDDCYAEDVSLSGFQLGSESCPVKSRLGDFYSGYVSNFDPLTGSGVTNRSVLTATTLINGPTPALPVITDSGFALPANAAPPQHTLEGQLQLLDEAVSGLFFERQDDYNYTDNSDTARKHLPEFDFQFTQSGTHVIPVQRGILLSEHPNWEFILEPGRVWSEISDLGKTRAVIPFALQQRNANCMHNGLMTFLFDDNSISKVFYQITSETCAYFQFDMWGLLDAQYTPQSITDALQIAANHQQAIAGRIPQKSIASLAIDYPGVNPTEFAHSSEVSPLDLSIFGVIVDGTHYVGGCETRYGTHPYCDALRVPSYSVAKTVLASAGALRLEKLHGDFFNQTISSLVPEAANNQQGNFFDVTINNALDMATGNYQLPGYFDDEYDSSVNNFFLPETYAEKINFAANQYPQQGTPGLQMHYHTSDTFLVMAAAQQYHREKVGYCGDIFDDVVVGDIWQPLGLDAGSLTTQRTYDPVQQPVGGLGASFVRDDIAKLGRLLGVDHGRINNIQVLEPEQLAAGKFASASDPGLPWISNGRYNNAFWGLNRGSIAGCSGLFVPYLSGFGGITVALAPSGVVYYYFSDGYSVEWSRALSEAEEIRSSCIASSPKPPTDLVIVDHQADALTLRWAPDPTPINVMRFQIYRDGQLIAVTSGNEWTDTDANLDESHEYFVQALDVVNLVSATGAVLNYQPATQPIAIPVLPFAGALITGFILLLITLRRRAEKHLRQKQ